MGACQHQHVRPFEAESLEVSVSSKYGSAGPIDLDAPNLKDLHKWDCITEHACAESPRKCSPEHACLVSPSKCSPEHACAEGLQREQHLSEEQLVSQARQLQKTEPQQATAEAGIEKQTDSNVMKERSNVEVAGWSYMGSETSMCSYKELKRGLRSPPHSPHRRHNVHHSQHCVGASSENTSATKDAGTVLDIDGWCGAVAEHALKNEWTDVSLNEPGKKANTLGAESVPPEENQSEKQPEAKPHCSLTAEEQEQKTRPRLTQVEADIQEQTATTRLSEVSNVEEVSGAAKRIKDTVEAHEVSQLLDALEMAMQQCAHMQQQFASKGGQETAKSAASSINSFSSSPERTPELDSALRRATSPSTKRQDGDEAEAFERQISRTTDLSGLWFTQEGRPVAFVKGSSALLLGDVAATAKTPIMSLGGGVFSITIDDEDFLGDTEEGEDGTLMLHWSDGETWVRHEVALVNQILQRELDKDESEDESCSSSSSSSSSTSSSITSELQPST